MKYAKLPIVFFITSLSTISLFVFVMYIFDPLQLFHKQWIYKNSIGTYMRQQAAGIINTKEFDSIILGTSMLENTSSKEASSVLGGTFTNISLSGSDYYERKPILEHALKNRSIKKVIYSLDNSGIVDGKMRSTIDYDYLYDENIFNDLYAYTNLKYIGCILNKNLCLPSEIDLDRPNAWYKIEVHSRRFGGIENWFKYKENEQVKKSFEKILDSIKAIKQGKIIEYNVISKNKKIESYLQKNILKYVKKYQNTEFILIVPPYSRIKYALMAQYNKSDFEVYINSLRYLVDNSLIYKNLKIYGWGNYSFVDEIKNYKDLTHYEYKYNSWMLEQISKNEGLLHFDNIDEYIKQFRAKAVGFDLFNLGNEIEHYLNKN